MHTRRVLKELIETALLALALFMALEFCVQNYRVEGSSMHPTLMENERLIVNKLTYTRIDGGLFDFSLPFTRSASAADGSRGQSFIFSPPKHGEIIIFHSPENRERDFVKRVIGVPGDTLEIRNGQVIRNGVEIDEPYVARQSSRSEPEVAIPEGHYYVMGDNRRGSNDSRDWGLLPERDIIGRAWLRYWPLDRWGDADGDREREIESARE